MLAQLLISGVAQGSIYAIVGLGLTVLYRATTVMNFAHGEMYMLGAFFVYVGLHGLGLPYAGAMSAAVLASVVLGFLVERVTIRPLLHAPHISLVMATVGLSYLFKGIARLFWGQDIFPLPPLLSVRPIQVRGILLTSQDLLITGSVTFLLVAFFGFFHATRQGKLVQAASQNLRGAALVGINIGLFFGAMWAASTVLGAVAGILVAPLSLLYPEMGTRVLIRAFAAMTLGGFGNLGGAVLGGVLMGVVEHLSGGYLSTVFMDIAPFVVIIFVLLVRPVGLLGRRQAVRV